MGHRFKFTKKEIANAFNPLQLYFFSLRIKEYVGTKFFLFLSYNYYITKGFLHGCINYSTDYYLMDHGLDNAQISFDFTISRLPWSMKGFIGVVSDLFPLFGYNKTSYLIIYTVIGSIGSLAIVLLPDEVTFSVWQLPALFMFTVHLQGSAGDLLAEGKYVEKMKERPDSKGAIVSYVWWCQQFGGFTPALFIGPLSNVMNLRWMFIPMFAMVIMMFPLLVAGCMVNDKVPSHMANRFDTNKFKENWRIMAIGFLMGCLAFALAFLAMSPYMVSFTVSLLGSIVLCIGVVFALRPTIAKAVIYLFLATATYAGDAGALGQWTLASKDCWYNAPHLSRLQVSTYGGLAVNIASLVGVWAYSIFLSKLKIRTMFWTTTVIRIMSGFFAISWTLRWNLAIGISDPVYYIVCCRALTQVLYLMDFMPSNILIAKMCPKKVEVTVYAILAGFSNFGQNVAAYYGIVLTGTMGIKSNLSKNECHFDRLPLLLFICDMLIPCVQIPAAFFLIPNRYIDDDILGEEDKKIADKYRNNGLAKEMEVGA